MYSEYYGRLFHRARQMTKAHAQLPGLTAAFIGAISVLLTQLILIRLGRGDLVFDNAMEVGAYLLVFPIILFVTFLFNCFKAAPELDLEWKALHGAAVAKLDRRAGWQEKLDRLWELRSEGISLRNRKKLVGDEFDDWVRRVEDWRERTEVVALEVDPNLMRWIHHLDTTVDNPHSTKFEGGVIHDVKIRGPKDEVLDAEAEHKLVKEWDRQVRMASTVLDRLARYLLKEFENPRRFDE